MPSYAYLDKLNVTDTTTTDYRMDDIRVNDVSPTLKVMPAHPSINKVYKSALFKRTTKADRLTMSRGNVDQATGDVVRKHDRELYPEHIILGWSDLKDDDGVDVPYSKEEAYNFIGKLPDWIFDNLRAFCINSESFGRDAHFVDDTGKKPRKSSPGS